MVTNHYQAPGWLTRNVFNRLVTIAIGAGLDVRGSRVLQVHGRTSGQLRETPVNLLVLDVEVGAFFDGVGPASDDAQFLRIAPHHPVFQIETIQT